MSFSGNPSWYSVFSPHTKSRLSEVSRSWWAVPEAKAEILIFLLVGSECLEKLEGNFKVLTLESWEFEKKMET
jgi:hypothetical protein